MTTGLFWISYGAAWVLLVALSSSVFVLFRFSARVVRTQGMFDIGDVGTMNGPALDASPPVLDLEDAAGNPLQLGGPSGGARLIVFAKSTCARCRTAMEVLSSLVADNPLLDATIVCGGDRVAMRDCASQIGWPMRAATDENGAAARRWNVSRFPFAVVLDSDGFVRGRGDPTSTALLTVLDRHMQNPIVTELRRHLVHERENADA